MLVNCCLLNLSNYFQNKHRSDYVLEVVAILKRAVSKSTINESTERGSQWWGFFLSENTVHKVLNSPNELLGSTFLITSLILDVTYYLCEKKALA